MPYTTFSDGSVLTASQVNTNWRDQVITTCTSGTRPSGTEGQHIYETDTDREYVYSGSGWVEYGGIGTWVSYTPVLTQSGAVTKTVTYAKWFKMGRTVWVQILLSATGAGSANNVVTVSLPFTAATSAIDVGSGHIFDASAGLNYPGIAYLNTTTTAAQIDTTAATATLSGQTGSTFAAALASGDAIEFSFFYEATA